eukprot:COSAG04_NODE_322_length_16880_cov_9.938621_4_plen_167_part_00
MPAVTGCGSGVRAMALGLALLASAICGLATPRAAAAQQGQDAVEGVFPQVGTGAVELQDEEVARALGDAFREADADSSGALTFAELPFRRIRARGDPVWTTLSEGSFQRMLGDPSANGGHTATLDHTLHVLRTSNLELDWRVPPPPTPPVDRAKRASSCIMETCGG